jgi:hypothetical protein
MNSHLTTALKIAGAFGGVLATIATVRWIKSHTQQEAKIDKPARSKEECIQMITRRIASNPDLLDWPYRYRGKVGAHPVVDVQYRFRVSSDDAFYVLSPENTSHVLNELKMRGHVDAAHEYFERLPVAERPFVAEVLNCTWKGILRNRAQRYEEVSQRLLPSFPRPLVIIIQNYEF